MRRPRRPGLSRSGDRASGAVLLSAVLLVAVVVAAALVVHFHGGKTAVHKPAHPPGYAVIFVIDGASPRDFTLARMPTLMGLERGGVTYRNAWVGQMTPTLASSNATISTGALPRHHGIVGPLWSSAGGKGVDTSTYPAEVRLGSLDQLLQARALTPTAQVLRGRYPSAPVLSVSGAGCVGASAAGTWLADLVLCPARSHGRWVPSAVAGHDPPTRQGLAAWRRLVRHSGGLGPRVEGWRPGAQDDWVAGYAAWWMRRAHPRLTIVNFPEVEILSRWSPTPERDALIGRLMSGIDRDMALIMDEVRRDGNAGRTAYVVTSDQAVSAVRSRIPRAALREAVLAAGARATYMAADGVALIGLSGSGQIDGVTQAVVAEHLRGVDAVYVKRHASGSWSYEVSYRAARSSARYRRAADYLLSTMAAPTSADVVILCAPGFTVGSGRLGRFHWTGLASSAQWPNQHIPLILSGPGVRRGLRSAYPARLVDVAPTLEALMGLQVVRGDGEVLADGLLRPPSGSDVRQTEALRRLMPVIAALQQRAARSG